MKVTFTFTAAVFGVLLSSTFISATPIPSTSEMEKRCSPLDTIPTYNAADSHITYSSGWTVLENQGSRDRDGVEAYNGAADASYSVEVPLTTGSIDIYAGKKDDRGSFDVYVGAFYVGSGDAYDATCTSNCQSGLIFSHTLDINTDYQNQTLTVKNRNADSRLGGKTPYLDLNYIQFTPPNC